MSPASESLRTCHPILSELPVRVFLLEDSNVEDPNGLGIERIEATEEAPASH